MEQAGSTRETAARIRTIDQVDIVVEIHAVHGMPLFVGGPWRHLCDVVYGTGTRNRLVNGV